MAPAITKDIKRFKEVFKETGEIKSSALAAGYSPHTASMGMHSMPKPIAKWVQQRQRKANRFQQLAASTTADQQELITRGVLLDNAISGKDKACNSLKMLGLDKRVSMWQAESQTGIIVIQPPPAMLEAIQARMLALTPDPKSLTMHVDTEIEPSKP